jgi:hypothetical protein
MAHQSRILIPAGIGLALVITACGLLGGLDGLLGSLLGAALSLLSMISLKLFADSLVPTNKSLPKASNLTVFVLLAKLPLVALLIYAATRLSAPGLYCFLATLALVYSAFVWRLGRAA